MLKYFLAAKRPVLGICRGMQVLNVAMGGTLCQDLRRVRKLRHLDSKRKKTSHTVTLTGSTKLRAAFGEEVLAVNSLHRSGVEDVAADLTVAARSGDGLPEALELGWHRFCIGVQWQPQRMAAHSPLQQQLFNTFVKACRVTAGERMTSNG